MRVADSPRQGKAGSSPRLTVAAEAVLEGARETLKALIRRRLTVANPKYQAARRYSRWIGKKLKPELYFFREEGDRLCFPRGFVKQAVLLCQQVTGSSPGDHRPAPPPAPAPPRL